MATTQTETPTQPPEKASSADMPHSTTMPADAASRLRGRLAVNTFSPVNQNGSFEFDRVIKSGVVQKRTQKTKVWKSVFLVLRPNTLSIYKTDKEDKLRHKIYLNDLTAVVLLKDPKQKRQNVFGLFSPSRNFHFEAPSSGDAQQWVDLIRKDARIEEEEEEMFLASPVVGRHQSNLSSAGLAMQRRDTDRAAAEHERMLSSSPEGLDPPAPHFVSPSSRKASHNMDSSGMSGNELVSQSDFSDNEMRQLGASIESLAVQFPPLPPHATRPENEATAAATAAMRTGRPGIGARNPSQLSVANTMGGGGGAGGREATDPDRVYWQGKLWFLRSKGGVRQWKKSWAVLRPRNLILYRDRSEYTAQFIVPLAAIVNVVDIDPISKTRAHCLQVITEEKSYKFCAREEEALVQCLGAFKSLFAKRRELEARRAAAAVTVAAESGSGSGSGAVQATSGATPTPTPAVLGA